jgi:hypothetical protein
MTKARFRTGKPDWHVLSLAFKRSCSAIWGEHRAIKTVSNHKANTQNGSEHAQYLHS